MGVTFIANVGSRDIRLSGHPNPPKDSRTLGELILANWGEMHQQIALPILGKALEWVLRKHPDIDQIVLFASDQTDSQYRYTDTLPFAQIIQRYIQATYGDRLAGRVQIIAIRTNPADYDQMMRFYSDALHAFGQQEIVYLEVTGGTPAMSFMLLWQGVETLQERAHPLYVLQERAMPISLNIARSLTVRALTETLAQNVRQHQYQAARDLLHARKPLLRDTVRYFDLVYALVEHANQRQNFNFDLAATALFDIPPELPPQLSARFHDLADDISRRDVLWLLREEIYGAEIDFMHGAFKDAVANIFAFREGLLRQFAIQQGTHLTDKGRKLDPDWLNTEPDLVAYLRSKSIDTSRNVTTFVFERILDFRARGDDTVRSLNERIAHFKDLVDIRNTATHNHGGVSEDMIRNAYGEVTDVLDDLRGVYAAFTGQPPGPNSYDSINALIADLLEIS